MRERWGSFSVRDHNATDKLVADVLAYDRLVFPVPSDPDETQRWRDAGWNPDLLLQRLDQFGSRAIRVGWDRLRRNAFADAMGRAHALADDARTVLPNDAAYQMTRSILSQDESYALPRGVTKIDVVSAFHSFEDLSTQYILDGVKSDRSLLALLVRNRIAHPIFASDPERSLTEALELSAQESFRAKRSALYGWQETIVREEVEPRHAMEELEDLISEYDACVHRAARTVRYNLLFTLCGVGLAFAGALAGGALGAAPFVVLAAGSGLDLVRFATLNAKPAIEPGRAAAAAMFHEMR